MTAAIEYVELMERLDFTDFKVSMKSTSVPNTIASNRLLSERIPYPLHLGVTEAGTKWSGSLKSAVGLGTLLADGIGDTIRISLSTFHAEEEVKVAWEILKALKLRERGPVLIACPTCGRLQFDMDSVVAEVERRLEAYEDPIEVSVLGCAVNGIGEARHADFGITGAKDMGMIYSKGEPLKKVADRPARRRALQGDRPLLRGRQDGRARRGAGRRGARVARRARRTSRDDAGAPGRDGGRRGGRGRAGRSDPGSARRGGLAGRRAAVQPGVGPGFGPPPRRTTRREVRPGIAGSRRRAARAAVERGATRTRPKRRPRPYRTATHPRATATCHAIATIDAAPVTTAKTATAVSSDASVATSPTPIAETATPR